jgi:hypothetical protein
VRALESLRYLGIGERDRDGEIEGRQRIPISPFRETFPALFSSEKRGADMQSAIIDRRELPRLPLSVRLSVCLQPQVCNAIIRHLSSARFSVLSRADTSEQRAIAAVVEQAGETLLLGSRSFYPPRHSLVHHIPPCLSCPYGGRASSSSPQQQQQIETHLSLLRAPLRLQTLSNNRTLIFIFPPAPVAVELQESKGG